MKDFLAWRLRDVLGMAARLRLGNWLPRRPRGRTLAIITGGLGDKLMALPAVRHLRQEFPAKPLTLVFLGLVPPFCEKEADCVLSIPQDNARALVHATRGGYDTCFVNSIGVFDVRCELAAFLTRTLDTRGPRYAHRDPFRVVYNHTYVFAEGHETVSNLRGAGGSTEADTLPYPLRLPQTPAPANEIIFHPGSSAAGLPNRWPTEHYARLAQSLHSTDQHIVAVGTPDERTILDRLHALTDGRVEIRTDLSLEQLALRLAAARLVVANDSGIGHLAAAVGAPLITIMGANQTERVAPIGSRVTIIGPRCEFGGCYNTPRAAECPLCITRITPDEVFAAARQVLSAA